MQYLRLWIGNFEPVKIQNTRHFLFCQLLAMTGLWLHSTAMALVVYHASGEKPAALGFAAFFSALPVILLNTRAGAMADRFDRRKILLLCHFAELVLAIGLGVLLWLDKAPLNVLYGFCFLIGLVHAFHFPAQQAFLYDLAGSGLIRKLVSLNSMLLNLCRTVAPPLASVVIASLGYAAVFVANGLCYLAMLVFLLGLARPASSVLPVAKSAAKVSFFSLFEDRIIRNIYLCNVALCVFGIGSLTQIPALAGGSPEQASQLYAAAGAGSLAYAVLFSPLLERVQRMGRALTWTLVWMAIWLGIAANTQVHALMLLGLFMFGLSTSQAMVSCVGMIQMLAPANKRGAMMGFLTLINIGVMPVAALFGGLLAQQLGVALMISLWAGAALVIATVLLFDRPWMQWRHLPLKAEAAL